jgi:ferredoxin
MGSNSASPPDEAGFFSLSISAYVVLIPRGVKEFCAMKVVVDLKLCEGNERCGTAAPEVFEVRVDDKSHLLVDRPPERLMEKSGRLFASARGRQSR